jgi:hypothetical protein
VKKGLDGGIDVMHGHFAAKAKLSAVYTARYLNISCTVTTHAGDIYTSDRTWLQRILNRMDHIITISEYNKSHLETNLRPSTPGSVARMGINLSKFEPTDNEVLNRLVTVARLDKKEGLNMPLNP